jgi:hypothetical protein
VNGRLTVRLFGVTVVNIAVDVDGDDGPPTEVGYASARASARAIKAVSRVWVHGMTV